MENKLWPPLSASRVRLVLNLVAEKEPCRPCSETSVKERVSPFHQRSKPPPRQGREAAAASCVRNIQFS